MDKNLDTESNEQSAWVVFSGKTDIFWLKILKPDFRHCFVLLNDGQRWTSIDPLSPYMDIQIYHHVEAAFNLPQWLENQGEKVVSAIIDKSHQSPAPWMLFTCVEAVKRILGVHNCFVVTPWQLYKFLKKHQNKNNNNRKENYHG